MTAIIWKEIREHLKWAVLWLLAMSTAVAVVLYNDRGESLCAGSLLGVLAFGGALGGTLLGLAQILPELRRGQWAFLVHRPVTRTRLFLGKLIGGLLLYLPAMGLPLVGAAIWAAIPGTVGAPFEARMVLPGAANILAGVIFYFAGLLTGLRPVRWYGSRALPLVAALPCLALVTVVPEFWMALLVIVICGMVLALAAWGSFLTAGVYAAQPRAAKAALGVVVLGGIVTVWCVLLAVANQFALRPETTWTRCVIDSAGRIVTIAEQYGTITKVTDLAGNELTEYQNPKARDTLARDYLRPAFLVPEFGWRAGYQNFNHYAYSLYSRTDVAWYYVFEQRRLLGYSKLSRRYVGSIGPEGFAPAGQAPGLAFAERLLWAPWGDISLLKFPHAIYRPDAASRRARLLYRAELGQEILAAVLIGGGAEGDAPPDVAIMTRSEILIADHESRPWFRVTYPYDDGRHSSVQLTVTPDRERYFAWFPPSARYESGHWRALSGCIVEFGRDGNETQRYELPTTPFPAAGPCWPQVLCASSVPALAVAGGNVAALVLNAGGPQSGRFEVPSIADSIDLLPPASIANVVALLASAALCAAVGLWLARRYAMPKSAHIGWTIGGFLLGPMGVLTLLALREWPAREACPACGKTRVVDRDECEHCGAPFPAPIPDGTEILEG